MKTHCARCSNDFQNYIHGRTHYFTKASVFQIFAMSHKYISRYCAAPISYNLYTQRSLAFEWLKIEPNVWCDAKNEALAKGLSLSLSIRVHDKSFIENKTKHNLRIKSAINWKPRDCVQQLFIQHMLLSRSQIIVSFGLANTLPRKGYTFKFPHVFVWQCDKSVFFSLLSFSIWDTLHAPLNFPFKNKSVNFSCFFEYSQRHCAWYACV